jgi:hypothetical protein
MTRRHAIGVVTGLLADHGAPGVIAWSAEGARAHVVEGDHGFAR